MSASDPIYLPKGFQFSAVAAGIKASHKPDLALISARPGTTAAALFTKNRIVAAPVEVGREALARNGGHVRAVLVNSGNANCATGPRGIRACKLVCAETARVLKIRPGEVFPSSTGIIGVPFPAEKVNSSLEALLENAGSSAAHLRQFAAAILTTDTRAKLASVPLQSGAASLTGVAKGAGMIHPQLATMLVYLLTDVKASSAELKSCLDEAGDDSFNTISIDGDTSTNDTVLLMASGEAGVELRRIRKQFRSALSEVCRSLAEQIVADGEGVQHVIRLRIEQAKNRRQALEVARAIAHSPLVKTAWAGADPNWGRILAAVGRSGIPIHPSKINIMIGGQIVCRGSAACAFDPQRAHEDLSKPECKIMVSLGNGRVALDFLTADLTAEYVSINAEYST